MSEPIEPNQQTGESPSGPERAVPFVLQDPMIRFDARVLDPATAVRVPGGEAPSPTVYVGDTLLVTAGDPDDGRDLLTVLDEAVKASGLPLQWVREDPFEDNDNPDHDARARLLRLAAERKLPLVFPVRFEPATDGPAAAVDVWPLLQSIRYAGRPEAGDDRVARLSQSIGLNHLMTAAALIGGNPFTRGAALIAGNPFTRGAALIAGNPFTRGAAAGPDSYLVAGSGGRGPVSVVLPPPVRSSAGNVPHVVVLDTGVGEHDWFTAQGVNLGLKYTDPAKPNEPSIWIGLNPDDGVVKASDPEGQGAIADPMLGLLATHSGHGTFIAGLIRQTCADAEITAARVMDSDGVVPEVRLTDALTGIGIIQSDGKEPFDALVMSLGYYSETGEDAKYTAGLRPLVKELALRGVAIFCAAGNDSTTLRSYPAAFADDPDFSDGAHLPMASVAALNPDSTVALFSNDGDWVNAEAAGANLVSTAPKWSRGGWNADTSFEGPNNTERSSIDPDSFTSGFCTWSGTSFAAPVLAGKYLAAVVKKAPASIEDRIALVGLGRPSQSG
jgi:hypothetical protein